MTQKVQLDFIITAKSANVTQELNRLNSQLNAMSQAARGPLQVNNALNQQMKLHQQNINALQGHSAAITKLNSVSHTFHQHLRSGAVTRRDMMNSLKGLTARTGDFSKEIQSVARQQLEFQSVGFQGFYKDMDGSIKGVAHTTENYGRNLRDITGRTADFRMQQFLAASQVQAYGQKLVKMGKDMQWTGRQITMGFTLPFALAMGAFANAADTIDKELTRIVKVYNFAAGEGEAAQLRLRDSAQTMAYDISQAYGFAAQETLEVMATFAQQGRRGTELLQMTQETMRTAFLGDVDTDNAQRLIRMLESSANIANNINIRPRLNETIAGVENATRSFQDLNDVLNRFNVLENNTVITVAELAEELPDLVGTLNSLNLSVEFGASALTAMKDAGLNVNESQTALKVGLQRLVSPTAKAARVFREMTGKDLNGLSEGAESAEEVIRALALSLKELDSFNARADVLSAIFGNRQSGRLSLLFDQIDTMGSSFQEAIEITGGFGGEDGVDRIEAYRTALEETEAVQESMSGQLQRAKAAFGALSAELGMTFLPALSNIVEWGAKLVGWFDSWPGLLKAAVIGTAALAGGFGLLVQIGGTVFNLFGSIVNAVGKLSKGASSRWLESMGVSAQIFATAEEALQKQMLETNLVANAQSDAMLRLQQTMQAAQGVMLKGMPSADPQMAQNAAAAQRRQLLNVMLQDERNRAKVTTRAVKAEQAILRELEKQLVVRERELEKVKASHTQTVQKRDIARQDLEMARAKAAATELEYAGRKELLEISMAERAAALAQVQARLAEIPANTRNKKLRAEMLSLQAQERVMLAQQKVDKGTMSRMDNKILADQQAELRAAAKLAALDKERIRLQNAKNVKWKNSLASEVQSLKNSIKDRSLQVDLDRLLRREYVSKERIAKLEGLISKEKLNQLRSQAQELQLAQQELAVTNSQVTAENRVTTANTGRLGRMRSFLGTRGRMGVGGAAMGIGMAAQSAMPDESVAGGLAAGAVSGAITGGMIGGLPGIIVGVVAGLAQSAGPLMQLGRNIGLIAEEAKGAVEQTQELAEALQLPFSLDPFEGVLTDGNSLSAQMRFESTDFGKEFVARFEDDRPALEAYMSEVIPTLIFGGMSEQEIREHVQPALNAVGAAAEDLNIGDFLFNADNSRESINEFANQINNMLADDMQENGGTATAEGMARAFEMGITALRTNKGQYARAAMEEFFTQSGILEVAESAGNEVGFEFTEATREIIDQQAESGMYSLEASFAAMSEELSNLVNTLPLDWEMQPELQNEEVVARIEVLRAALLELDAAMDAGELDWSGPLEALSSGAVTAKRTLLEFADAMDIEVPPGLQEAPEIFDAIARQLLGPAVAEEYERQLQRLAYQNSRVEVSSRDSAAEIQAQAWSLAMLADQAEGAVGALAEFEDADQQAAWDEMLSNYRSRAQAIFTEFGNELVQPFRDAAEAEDEIWDERLDALGDRLDDQRDALSDHHSEESRLFGIAQQEQMEVLTDRLSDELEAFDDHTEALEQQAQDAADARIAALEEEEEAVNELDRQRELAYEREKRRQDYFISLRNSSVSLAVALATGDVEQATQIRGEIESSTSEYNNARIQESLEEQRREEEAAREVKREQIQTELDAELDRIETTRETEREALEETHKQRVKLLQEEQRLALNALKDRQEAEQDALQDRMEAERTALQEQREHSRQMGQSRIEAAQKALDYAIDVVNPQTKKDWHRVVDVMNERLVTNGTVEGHDGFQNAVSTAGINAARELGTKLDEGVMLAAGDIAADARWEAYGSEMADRISGGMFGDVTMDQVMSWMQGGSNPFAPPTPTNPGGGGPQEYSYHSGGKIHGGIPSRAGLGPDERPIVAQTGEYMIQRKAVQKLGVPFLDRINQGKGGDNDGLRYHDGGIIGGMLRAVTLPYLGIIRAMGEAGGKALNPEGMSAFAKAFPGITGNMVGAEAIEAFMAAIKQKESGGNYNASNPSGATGAYQILRSNWPSWAAAAGIGANAPWTPANQDTVAKHRMTHYYDTFGSWEAVAAAWYGGAGAARRYQANPNDPYLTRKQFSHGREYPSIIDYINSVMSLAGTLPAASGFGPFTGYGAFGTRDLQPPDWDKTWRYANWKVGLAPHVIEGTASTLAALPGAQYVSSALRPNIGNASSQHITGHAVDLGPYNWYNTQQRIAGLQAAQMFYNHPWVRKDQVFFGPPGAEPFGLEGHADHLHVGFKEGISLPQMMVGGKVKYDNTLANLHHGETVLTEPLTRELERGIRNVSNNRTINIYPSPGMDEQRFANYVIQRLQRQDRLQGKRANA